MATYYVRKDGIDTANGANDTTDPSTGAFLTIDHAITTVGNNDIINVGPGTYAEGANGTWGITKVNTRYVTVQATTGDANSVIITCAGTGGYGIRFHGGAAYLKFKNLRFTDVATQPTLIFGTCDHLYFDHCQFLHASTTNVVDQYSSALTTNNVTFDNCELNAPNGGGIYLSALAHANPPTALDNIMIINCTFRSIGTPLVLLGVTNVYVRYNTVQCESSGGFSAILLGIDNTRANGQTTTGTVADNTILSRRSHSVTIGAGCQDLLFTRNKITGGNYSIVAKNCGAQDHRVYITNNTLIDGFANSILLKGAQYTTVTGNDIYNRTSTLNSVLECRIGDSGPDVWGNLVICNNHVRCGAQVTKAWNIDTNESGAASVWDYNNYEFDGSQNWGTVKGVTVTSIDELRTALGGSNEAHGADISYAPYWATVLKALPTTPTSGSIGALAKTAAQVSDIPTDYQQRDAAVTLPTEAPEGYGGTGLDAAEMRTAVGLATANLDTQLAAVQQGDAAVTLPTEAPEGYGGTGLDAAEMRTAVGLATANLDTQLAGPLNADLQKIKGLAVTCRRAVTILNRVGKYVAPQGLIAGLRGGKKSKQPKNRRQVKR
jgi:hypothetical protein